MTQSKPSGRTPKISSDTKKHWISIRMDDTELNEFKTLFQQSREKDRTRFIKACLFNRPLKVITFNQDIYDYWLTLTKLQAEYRSIATNYNQITKAINSSFSEKQVLFFLRKVETETIKLIEVNQKVIILTEELKEKWLQK